MQTVASILWNRLDGPGHDACRLQVGANASQLDGTAVFRHSDGQIAQLHYRVRCDGAWHARWGAVQGWLGNQAIDLSITRDDRAGWKINETLVPALGHCIDLDIGFTPATNLFAVRRLQLEVGEAGESIAAWLDIESLGLSELAQRYERSADDLYGYSAPHFDYSETLSISHVGFVLHYPDLWQSVTEIQHIRRAGDS